MSRLDGRFAASLVVAFLALTIAACSPTTSDNRSSRGSDVAMVGVVRMQPTVQPAIKSLPPVPSGMRRYIVSVADGDGGLLDEARLTPRCAATSSPPPQRIDEGLFAVTVAESCVDHGDLLVEIPSRGLRQARPLTSDRQDLTIVFLTTRQPMSRIPDPTPPDAIPAASPPPAAAPTRPQTTPVFHTDRLPPSFPPPPPRH